MSYELGPSPSLPVMEGEPQVIEPSPSLPVMEGKT